jgi:NRAMP (natural resistance-associated macrophage protein)-like metal ion transporter
LGRHLYFVGPGLVSAVAYIDPGNWATDLQAGSQYGYKLLFIVLIAGLAAVGESRPFRFLHSRRLVEETD